jgi:hypothetical protein
MRPTASLTFVCQGEARSVDLGAPRRVRRSGRSMVSLMDLWVATLLPADVLDVTFEIVTDEGDTARRSAPLDGLRFGRGFIATTTRELWWEDAADRALQGARAQSVLVHVEPGPLALAEPVPGPSPVATANLSRLLPHASMTYPPVQWRRAVDVEEGPEPGTLHAYLLALGLRTT